MFERFVQDLVDLKTAIRTESTDCLKFDAGSRAYCIVNGQAKYRDQLFSIVSFQFQIFLERSGEELQSNTAQKIKTRFGHWALLEWPVQTPEFAQAKLVMTGIQREPCCRRKAEIITLPIEGANIR